MDDRETGWEQNASDLLAPETRRHCLPGEEERREKGENYVVHNILHYTFDSQYDLLYKQKERREDSTT